MALTMAALSYVFTQDAVKQNSRDYTELLVAQIQTNIDSYVTYMENIAEVVRRNEQVQSYLTAPATLSPSQRARDSARISGFFGSIAHTRNDISLILLVDTGGRVITDDSHLRMNRSVNIRGQQWFTRAWDADGKPVISSPHVQNIVAGEYRWVITLSRTINDIQTGRRIGVLMVDLNFSVINNLVHNISLGKKGYLFIVDTDGGIVYHPRQELLYSGLEREPIQEVLSSRGGSFMISDPKGERMYTVSISQNTGWRAVGVNYVSELVRNSGTIQRYYFSWTLVCLALAIFIALIISHRLSSPIMRLRKSMQAVEQGNFDVTVDAFSNNEIGALARDFNIMIAQIRELVQRNAAEQEQKRKSELLALQNQIAPHFLYNTLDSVIWMAEGRQYANVIKTISALARLLRLSISTGDELITIHDEIEHIKSYLTIQKLRYRDKLDFAIDVDSSLTLLRTPKVILQPLVENAIYHGIKNKSGTGQVRITGRRTLDRVEICVADDGIGMSEEQRNEILIRRSSPSGATAARNRPGRRSNRVGVRNVHERIQLYFGPGYGLSYGSNGDSGTVVTVRLPVVESGESANE
jgi:two-component system sensor histidine kinase YesM